MGENANKTLQGIKTIADLRCRLWLRSVKTLIKPCKGLKPYKSYSIVQPHKGENANKTLQGIKTLSEGSMSAYYLEWKR